MKVLVLFAGHTDEPSYRPILSELQQAGIPHRLRLGSAHKSPRLVEEILKDTYDLIIAGAGLAAALPGVVAAHTIFPVLGVPCPGAYGGLDAFLSIVQMPPGVPVLAVSAARATQEAQKILNAMTERWDRVAVIGEGKIAERVKTTLDEMAIRYENQIAPRTISVMITHIGEEVSDNTNLTIYCPSGETNPNDAIAALQAARYGLWVGVNRGENAAIAVAEIMGKHNALTHLRKKYEEKCRQQDKEIHP